MAEAYPPDLIARISDGRCPLDSEVEQIAGKTLEEGVRFIAESTPSLAFHLVQALDRAERPRSFKASDALLGPPGDRLSLARYVVGSRGRAGH